MYIIVKNGAVLPYGINKYGYKYIDECKAAAIAACDDPEDVVEIYNLETPEVKYTLELVTQEKVEEGAGNETGGGVKPSIDKTPENQVNPA